MGSGEISKHIILIAVLILFLPFGGETKRGGASRGSLPKAKPPTQVRPPQKSNPSGSGSFGSSGHKPSAGLGGSSYKPYSSYRSLSPTTKVAIGGIIGAGVGFYVGNRLAHSFHHGGHTYWYGDRYYRPSSGMKTCVFEVDESTPNWNVTDPVDRTVIRKVIYDCPSYQTCCDMKCCGSRSSSWQWWQTLLLILAMLLMFACCASFLFTRYRRKRNFQESSGYVATSTYQPDNTPKNFDGFPNAENQAGFYPQQPYSNNPAVPPAYPQYGGGMYPQAAAAPPSYGFQQQQYPPPNYPGYQPVRTY